MRYRVGDSPVWVGVGNMSASTTVKFNVPTGLAGRREELPDRQSESRVGSVPPVLSYDSRDNLFTPNSGNYIDLSAGIFSKAMGGYSDFDRVSLSALHYQSLFPKLTFGVMAGSVLSHGDVPFYLRPYVSLRGVAAMRYQGAAVAQIEAELRWQFWERFSLVGFGGAGGARNNNAADRAAQNVHTAGVGLRYEIARKYGLHMGLDLAYGPDGPVWYVQFGSAWMRP